MHRIFVSSLASLLRCAGATAGLLPTTLLLTILGSGLVSTASAGDTQTLGMFALVDDAQVRESLSLSADKATELADFLTQREMAAAALRESLADASPADRQAELAKFATESEQIGSELLSPEQLQVLRRWHLASRGMASLSDPFVVEQLGLNDDQQRQITELLTRRDAELAAKSGLQADLARQRYEVELAKVLTSSQFAGWRILVDDVPSVADETNVAATTNATEEAAEGDPAASQEPRQEPSESNEESGVEAVASGEPATANDRSTEAPPVTSDSSPQRDEPMIRFSFENTEWEPVLTWFADQAGLSLQMDYPPEGTFNYQDETGEYTVAEALDQINHVLLTRGFTLVRNNQMLMLVNLEDGIPRAVIETVRPEELDERGRYEVLRCIYDLQYISSEEIENQIEPLIEEDEQYGGFYSVTSANRLVVQSTGDKLRLVQELLEAAKEKYEAETKTIGIHKLQHVTPEEVMSVARPLLDIDADEFGNDEIRIAVEDFGTRIFFQGNPETIKLFQEIIDEVDVQAEGEEIEPDLPYLKIYEVRANPETVRQVLGFMLAGNPDARLQIDPDTGNLIARARQADHEFIQKTIDEMQQRTTDIAVIQLREYDPASVITMVTNLLNLDVEGTSGPTIDADPIRNQIVVRGTPQQVAEIRTFVEGLDPPAGGPGANQQRVRVLPITGQEAKEVVDYMETIWPSQGRQNRLRIVWPEEQRDTLEMRAIPSLPEGNRAPASGDSENGPLDAQPARPGTSGRPSQTDSGETASQPRLPALATQFVTYRGGSAGQEPASDPGLPARFRNLPATPQDDAPATDDGPQVTVRVTPYGLILESDDTDALNTLEDLIYQRPLVDTPVLPSIYYLKYAKAEEADSLLKAILGLSGSGGGGGVGNLVGGFAQQFLGGPAGDIVGGLLGPEGGGASATSGGAALETTGPVGIVADPSKNALIISANEADLELIDELLAYIDQAEAPQGPNPFGKSYVIPVQFRDAQELTGIIQTQLADRIRTQQGGGGGGDIDPRELQQRVLQQLLGGRGGRRGGGGGGGDSGVDVEPPKMAISADPTSNSILVTGPEFLYQEVRDIVEQLDRAEVVNQQTVSVIELSGDVNAEILRQALQNVFGENIQTSGGSNNNRTNPFSRGNTNTNRFGGGGGNPFGNNPAFQQMMQRRLQGGRGGNNSGGGGRSRGGRGR